MRKMKDCGIVRLGLVPEKWGVSRVKYIYSVIGSGTTPPSGDFQYYDGEEKWIQSGDLYKRKYVTDTEEKVTGYAVSSISALHKYKADFIVVAMYGASIGNVAISKIDACVNQACCVIKPNSKIDFSYLYYTLVNDKDIMLDMSIGGTQPNISQAKILELPVFLPPFAEQKKIAAFLDDKIDRIDSIRAELLCQIELLNDYKKSLITEAVTKGLNPNVKLKDSEIEWIGKIPKHWVVKQLKRIAKVYNGKEIEDELDQDADNAIKVYGSGGVFKYTNKYLYKGEAVLFGRKGTIGKPLLANGCFWTVDTMYYSVCFPNNDNRFLYYILKVFPWEPYTTQTALPSVVASEVFQNSIGVPPFSEQKEIADYLDEKCSEIDSIVANKQKQIEILDEYKKSLIFEYVTGKKEVPV